MSKVRGAARRFFAQYSLDRRVGPQRVVPHDGHRDIAVRRRGRMKMNFRLMWRPLACAPNEKHNFSLNRLDVQDGILVGCVFVAPNVDIRLLEVMSPRVTVVTALAIRAPAKTQAIAEGLLRDPDVDRLFIDAHDV